MKICTITCHNVFNHGATLQSYALLKYLTKLGHNVEIIDYRPNYLSNHYNLLSIDSPKWKKNKLTALIYLIIKIPNRLPGLLRKRAFEVFTRKSLKVSKARYKTINDLKNNPPIADAYICGSDQIWNSTFENGRDPSFYLEFVSKSKLRISYAASFATETIRDEIKSFVKERVGNLNAVSVREESGKSILKELGLTNVTNVVDPVLLLNKEEWNSISKSGYKEKYILVYDFDNNSIVRKLALELSRLKGYRIYSVNPGKVDYADKYFKYVGPDSFISLIRDSQFIISNSYHAAVFSVLYRKDFAIVNRYESINTRMRDFLEELNLSERIIDQKYNIDTICSKIDYQNCESFLEDKIENSRKFLNDSLELNNTIENIS